MYYDKFVSPFGLLHLGATSRGLFHASLTVPTKTGAQTDEEIARYHLTQCKEQLHDYFAGTRSIFSVQLAPFGTVFQQRVWRALQKISYGECATYGDIAKRIDNPLAYQAVGMACRTNPILLLIPCHRVVGKKGALTGFQFGISMKKNLLEHEQKYQEAQSGEKK
ncbi:MAG: methylated-DNA--[protein]-cysteine S-methyltransferase [Vibrionaceae bacterium]